MRYFYLFILTGCLLIGVNVRAEEGKEIFDSLRCGICHKVDRGKTVPSLREVARFYNGKEDRLSSYLKGEAEPLINPEKAKLMKTNIKKTKALKDEERKSLIDFILSHLD